jgi:hypothetical protein
VKLKIPYGIRLELEGDFRAWEVETGSVGHLTALSDASDYSPATHLTATTNLSHPITINATWFFQADVGVLDDFTQAHPLWASYRVA